MKQGYLYYLDGAGGGTVKKNWSAGVRQGLLEAGYPGAGEMFSWETGLGLIADQDASVRYKRTKARKLAREIQRQAAGYPPLPSMFWASPREPPWRSSPSRPCLPA